MATYAYARISSDSPSLSAQEAELRKAGANITFADENHVGATRRGELAKALKLLKAGDVLLVTRLEHLAGSISELLDILHVVGKAGAAFKSLAEPWADTTRPTGVSSALRGLATLERKLKRSRNAARRLRAQSRGVQLGRRPKLTLSQREQAISRLKLGWPQAELALVCGVAQSTISRLARGRR